MEEIVFYCSWNKFIVDDKEIFAFTEFGELKVQSLPIND